MKKSARAVKKRGVAKTGRTTVPKSVPVRPKLIGISDIRRYFHRNEEPIYFISATPFNLLGIDEWVRNFHFINYIDCFDGKHPSVFVPSPTSHPVFESIEQINNHLLRHPEVERLVKDAMMGAADLIVPLEVTLGAGSNWLAAH